MYMVLWGLGGLCFLVGFICWIIVVINAFKTDTTQGILSLCIFPYTIYWAFAKFVHPKKMMIAGGMLAGYVLGYGLYFAGGMMAASAFTEAAQQMQMQMMQPGAIPGAIPGSIPGYPPPTQ